MTKIQGSAVVLLSGGQDSTTVLYLARSRYRDIHAVTVHYGQTHSAELAAAAEIAVAAGVASHVFVPLVDVFTGSKSALVTGSGVALQASGGMSDVEAPDGLPTSFVPGRNLLLLSVATARAGAVGAETIFIGVCQTDYSGYPDCREVFVHDFAQAVRSAWPSHHKAPTIQTPLMRLTKAQTVELAHTLPGCYEALGKSITCYRGERPGCGKCPACDLRAKGFDSAGFKDPAQIEWAARQ
jgi:7-cyano-7-deazaguanine synthase